MALDNSANRIGDNLGPLGSLASSLGADGYVLELWNTTRETVELVLGITLHPSTGLAAFYSALTDYPGRYITLRHGDSIAASTAGAFIS